MIESVEPRQDLLTRWRALVSTPPDPVARHVLRQPAIGVTSSAGTYGQSDGNNRTDHSRSPSVGRSRGRRSFS